MSCACSSLKLYSHPQTPSSRPHHHQHNNRTMPSKALPGPDDPSRSGWQWEKVKATMAEEYHNPAKWEANCKGVGVCRCSGVCCCCCSGGVALSVDDRYEASMRNCRKVAKKTAAELLLPNFSCAVVVLVLLLDDAVSLCNLST